ncbi:MAG: 3'-5' exonuclease [Bacteroidales bacterium]|jgi:ribonuclease D|nr:3'-5' exonuclease [Bacteroidales bacterium]
MENNCYPETISEEDLGKCEISWFRGEIVLIEDMAAFNETFPRLKGSKVLGFDTETKPSFKKGRKNKVSLIQLANDELACLIRINKVGMPAQLAGLLADENIIKAGVAVHDDIRFLKSVRGFDPLGFVDLQKFVREYGIQVSGLKKLAAIVLGFRISKRQQVTDWEADQLSEAQIVYAATDAWVCHQIYKKLVNGN